MKRIFEIILASMICVLPGGAALADTYIPSRTINLVYDDSGSMLRIDGTQTCVDTWCQAKYAMEVVASMLDERDELNIYYMSDYVGKTETPPRLRLHGSRDAQAVAANVAQIHNTITHASNTPFAAVKKAYADLRQSHADENWLVVLTDGEFEDGKFTSRQVEEAYQQFTRGGRVKVMMLAMGGNAAQIKSDEARGIYFEHAVTTKEIRTKLTGLTNQIFQRNALEQKDSANISFDVPMKQLIVFAQGKDIQINGIKRGDQHYAPSANVHAMYSTQSSDPKPSCNLYDETLNGKVATFNGAFLSGDYQIELTGTPDSIEVYYKPDVDVKLYLYDEIGNDVTDKPKLNNGKYKIGFGFVRAGTDEKVPESKLLGEPEFEAKLVNNDKEMQVHAGDIVEIRDGTLDGDFHALYLKYNRVHTKLEQRSIYFTNPLEWQVDGHEAFHLTKEGLSDGNVPVRAHIRMKDGESLVELTAEQWAALSVPDVVEILPEAEDDSSKKARRKKKAAEPNFTFKVEKDPGEAGKVLIYPSVDAGRVMSLPRDIDHFVMKGCTEFALGESTAYGCSADTSIAIQNDIKWWEYFLDWLERWWKWILAFIILLGYVPPVKKYLPGIPSNPDIEMKANKLGKADSSTRGEFKRSMLNILPYRRNTGELNLKKITAPGLNKTLKLKATGGKKVILENAKDYAGKTEITFGGLSVPAALKKGREFKFGTSQPVTVKTENFIYNCTLLANKKARKGKSSQKRRK
ncbi:MAG: hypothetical protein IJ165_07005 [Proteobacteria bacterium]|nr:hypothetical protein [Pseudomonadota bacterium]